jgi:hypothetical protein
MATEAIDKDFVTIRVSKKIGTAGIKNLETYARFLEINKGASKRVTKKKVLELADEVTAAAWKKFKKQHKLQ